MVRRWLFTQTSFVGDPEATLGRVETDAPGLVRQALGLPPGSPRPDGSFRLDAAVARGRGVILDTVLEPVTREGGRVRVPLRWAAASSPGPTFEGAFEAVRVVAAVDGVTDVEDRVRWSADDVPRAPHAWAVTGNAG